MKILHIIALFIMHIYIFIIDYRYRRYTFKRNIPNYQMWGNVMNDIDGITFIARMQINVQ